jgi:hypothetical protein
VFNWRIVLGGAASAAILTAGVAAPAFAVPRASSPVPLNGITQSISGSQAGGIFCALPNLPVSVGITAAAGAIGETCGGTQVNSSSQSVIDPQQASASQAGRLGGGQDIGRTSGQANGPAQITSAPQASGASGASGALPGLNSLSGAIPNLSNAASVVPNVGNVAGSLSSGNSSVTGAVSNLVPGNGNGGLNSVSNAVGGVTGGLAGGSQP